MNRKFRFYISLVLFSCLGFSSMGLAQENVKLAQTGFQFLSVVSDARAAALAGSMNSLDVRSSALFFNPASMGFMNGFVDASFSKNNWIADIAHNNFSAAINPNNGRYGAFGFTLQNVDYGDVQGTVVADNEQGYIDTGIINPSAIAVGLGYARRLNERFAVGGQIRYVRQSLGENNVVLSISSEDTTTQVMKNEVSPLAFDFGTLFKTGLKSLAFGMSVRNFSTEVEYAEEGFQLPLIFNLGVSMNLMDLFNEESNQAVLLSVNATHPRSHPEQLIVGLEYSFQDAIYLRGGYITNNDEDDVSFGFGVSQLGLEVDYAYTPFGVFDNVQRFTIRFWK